MRFRMLKLRILFLSPVIGASVCSAALPAVNQLGYTPKSQKLAVIPGNDANPLEIREMNSGKSVLTVEAPLVYEWNASGEEVQTFDFSKLTKAGTYQLVRNGDILGAPIQITERPYEDVAKAALKWFYFQRSSTALDSKYAGKWARAAGHPDTHVLVYGENRSISAPKGWYDAGDYGKYIVNSGITVSTLLDFYENYTAYADQLVWDIPREMPNLPLILEEVRWNLDWMLDMQDQDGSVFHKLTTLRFSSTVMPEGDKADRYAIGKGIAAALDFAGTLAQASVIYKKFDAAYADRLLKAAERAYAWAKKNPKNLYSQPADVNTGSYQPADENGKDEFRFAAAELYRATQSKKYLDELKANPVNGNGPWWGDMNFLAVYRMAKGAKLYGKELHEKAKQILLNEAESLLKAVDSAGYYLAMHPWNWTWGSNSAVANNGIILLHAYKLTGNVKYLNAAQQSLDYLLGKNPLQISYVTGFGHRSPQHPHHRPSEADNVDEPIPGMLVGGPHLGKQDIGKEAWKCEDYAKADKPALAYLDAHCSYATNEVAINWNAPFAYLAAALQAIYLE